MATYNSYLDSAKSFANAYKGILGGVQDARKFGETAHANGFGIDTDTFVDMAQKFADCLKR